MKPDNFPQQPAHLWEHFYQLTQIPRPSKQEAAVRAYLVGLARERGLDHAIDAAGNLVIYLPASPGREDHPTVIVQNHLDMVTVKSGDSSHDFSRDPLALQVVDGWVGARDTTLGADNGIGCAAATALMTDPGAVHPPLQLLFTVDEETGLGGALNLDTGMLDGELMLNLDTEEWGELYVGCAGGIGLEFTRSFALEPARGGECWELRLKGLAGGHSGIQIHEQLGNAVKLLAEALEGVSGLRIAAFEAGLAHNVIPREGSVLFACAQGEGKLLAARLGDLRARWLGYLPPADAGLALELAPGAAQPALDEVDTRRLLDLAAAWPHGVLAYNAQLPGELPDLSVNLAALRLQGGELLLETSYRFFDRDQSLPLEHSLAALGRAFDLDVTPTVGYPGWKPDFDGELLARAGDLYRRLFHGQPAVKAIHAGLECGILKDKLPRLDILSFGPTIRGAHSPAERVKIDTVTPFWQFLTVLLAEI